MFASLSEIFQFQEITLPVWIALGLLVLFAVVLFLTQRRVKWDVRTLCVGAICIALGFILSYIRIYRMPQGGSVTAGSMLPIMLFAFLFGWRKGILCAMAYGLLQLFQDFWAVNLLQLVLEYPMAFGCLAAAGIFYRSGAKWAFPAGIALAILGRLVCHTVAGAVFFAEYAGDQNPWIYSVIYNGSYLLVEGVLCAAVAVLLQVRGTLGTLRRVLAIPAARNGMKTQGKAKEARG